MKMEALGKRLRKVPPALKLFICLLINLVLFAGLYFKLLAPQSETLARVAEELNTLNEKWVKMNAAKKRMATVREEYEALNRRFYLLSKQLPEEKDVPSLLRGIARLARESQLRVKYFEPKGLVEKEFYAELPFELRYSGSFHSVGDFFEGLRRMERIVKVDEFSLEAKGNFPKIYLDGTCTAKTFVYLKREAKTKKGEKGEGSK